MWRGGVVSSTVSFADDCRQTNSTCSLVASRGYIALYPRAWRFTSASDVVARRGAVDCGWTISAERGRRITLFSARVGAHLHRADEVAEPGGSSAVPGTRLWCPASVQLVELDGSVAAFNVCLRHSDADLSQRQPHDTATATRTVYESKGSQLEVRLSFEKDKVSMTSADQWRLSDILHVLYYIGRLCKWLVCVNVECISKYSRTLHFINCDRGTGLLSDDESFMLS